MTSPLLSVIIPTLNRENHLVDTIKQVLADRFQDLELIVVDQTDQHEPDTQRYLESVKDPRFHYFLVTPKSGVAAKNYGLKRAQADIVVFLDDDITLDPDCLSAHYEAYQTHPDIGGVAGRVKQHDIPITKTLLHFNKYGISPYTSFNYETAEYTDTAAGGNMSVKRAEALAVGGFDTNFLRSQHREESEFCARYYRAGHTFWFEPRASLTHLVAHSGGTRHQGSFADHPDFYKNNLYFVLKTCQLRNLPVALVVQLRFYALRKDLGITVRRTGLFIWGLIVAIKRLIVPVQITAKLVRELP